MKKYVLDFKYIRNKQVAPFAILSCIFDAIPRSYDDDGMLTTFNAFTTHLSTIIRADMNPENLLNQYDALETLDMASSYYSIENDIMKVESFIEELIVIEFKGIMAESDIMQFVPSFDPEKVKIEIPESNMFPEINS